MELTQNEIGYLAGFIDGEGSFLINRRNHVGYKGKIYVGYSAYIDIGNTNLDVLKWIHNKLGVTASIYCNPQKGNRKTAYRIRIGYKLAKLLTVLLLPYLIVKKKQAELFLNYGSANNQEKELLWTTMKQHNHRGVMEV